MQESYDGTHLTSLGEDEILFVWKHVKAPKSKNDNGNQENQ